MIDVRVEIVYGIQLGINYTRHDWLGKPRRGCSSTALALGHRTTMLATARLAKHFSATRAVRPARYISSSSARRSDALFVVCLLRCPCTFLDKLTSTLQHRDKPYNNPGVPFHSTLLLFPTLHLLRSNSSSLRRIFHAPMKSSPITRLNTRRRPLSPSSTSDSGRTKVGRV
jgi:hypothetical protein